MTIERAYELLNGGDWACAWGEPETLAAVSLELAGVLEPGLAGEADAISSRALHDFADATRRWARLASRLEHGLRIDPQGRLGPAHHEGTDMGFKLRELMTMQLLAAMDL
jgi:hypothetical protein